MTLQWYSSQISSLGNCVDDTSTETGLTRQYLATVTVALNRRRRRRWPMGSSTVVLPAIDCDACTELRSQDVAWALPAMARTAVNYHHRLYQCWILLKRC